ncbi:hypothetical protein REPUB_Repub17cG0105800 [Reevesia pubescens]
MGQFCIEFNVDMMGLLLALIIAIALLLTCIKQPASPRRAMVVTNRIGKVWKFVLLSCKIYRTFSIWEEARSWAARRFRGKSLLSMVLRLAWNAFHYHISRERNRRVESVWEWTTTS